MSHPGHGSWFRHFLAWDLGLAHRVSKGFRFPAWIEKLLHHYTRIGDGWIWLILLVAVFGSFDLPMATAIAREACITALFAFPIYKQIKSRVKRRRPYQQFGDGDPRIDPLDKFSFPSGHTMNNMAISLALFNYKPLLGGSLAAVALSWGLLRIHFGVHFLSDVVAGAFLAMVCAFLGHETNLILLQLFPTLPG